MYRVRRTQSKDEQRGFVQPIKTTDPLTFQTRIPTMNNDAQGHNRRDQSQITHLGRQKVKFFQECYADATSKPYGYLLIDLKPETDESLRVRTGMFPGDVFMYINLDNPLL
ncbi:uncharacterized protein TNCV_1148791 [Trichonephila clavipes]|nr:uncharacterized protein TNCV_1148791 [Trichonephila clavipes]